MSSGLGDLVANDLSCSANAVKRTMTCCTESVVAAAVKIMACFQKGGRVWVAGNGGSAADAQHFAGELVGWFIDKQRRPLPVVALTTDTSVLTAIANDAGVDRIFSRQICGFGSVDDVFVGISTSGESENIVQAAWAAQECGMGAIGLTGDSTSRLSLVSDISIRVPSNETPYIQVAHAAILHAICLAIDHLAGDLP